MRTLLWVTFFVGFLPIGARADVTVDELQKLASAGISEPVILEFIKENGPVQKLSAEDLLTLKKAGATERVLAAAVASPGAQATPVLGTSSAPPAEVVEHTVIVPDPIVTYEVAPYFYAYPTTGVSLWLGASGCWSGRRLSCRPWSPRLALSCPPRFGGPRFPCSVRHR
jgi:hypothetical protein